MPGFDLHTHSTFSDGTLDPERVVELAATRGLTGIALTDHDNTGGVERARAAAAGTGLTVLLGCELSAEHDDNPVHVLAYGFDPGEPAFAAKRAWIFEGRVARTRRMVQRLRELGAPGEG
jgi:3',5'-nucleoside bisphosphate phosphatase